VEGCKEDIKMENANIESTGLNRVDFFAQTFALQTIKCHLTAEVQYLGHVLNAVRIYSILI